MTSITERIDDDLNKVIKKQTEGLKNDIEKYLQNILRIQETVLSLSNKLFPTDFIEPLKKLFQMIKSIPLDNIKDFVIESEKVVKTLSSSVKE